MSFSELLPPARALLLIIANHLWESTLVLMLAAVLVRLLRSHHAQTRYRIWFVASLKFLIPFPALVYLGRHLPIPIHPPTNVQPVAFFALDAINRPFSMPIVSSAPERWTIFIPVVLILFWFCGTCVVLIRRMMQWQQVSQVLREATILHQGREVDALNRASSKLGMPASVTLVLTREMLEPGVFGIGNPVLLWPTGVSEQLEDMHVEAIMSHELQHIRRRDNLNAMFHILVEVIFWFHPLVWYLGAKLIDEREGACDEAVLQSGYAPRAYAESLLKVCEYYVAHPLGCVAGITGTDLKRRIGYIVTTPTLRKLSGVGRALLFVCAVVVIGVQVASGRMQATEALFVLANPVAPPPPPPRSPQNVHEGVGMLR